MFKTILSKEGPLSFYKGVKPVLASMPVQQAICFSAYSIGRQIQGFENVDDMTMHQVMLAGAFTGIIYSIALTPIDLIKIRQQMENIG